MHKNRFYLLLAIFLVLTMLSLFLGSIPPSPLYYLKITRETIQTYFIFGDEDKTYWLLTRADKRLIEAEKLKNKHLGFFSAIQIETAKKYQTEAETQLQDLKNKTNITYLKDMVNQNNEKMKNLETK